jgi:hypothetical protein
MIVADSLDEIEDDIDTHVVSSIPVPAGRLDIPALSRWRKGLEPRNFTKSRCKISLKYSLHRILRTVIRGSILFDACVWIFKQSMGTRNQVGIELSYRPARLHSLAELVPWNRFSVSSKV